MSVRRRGTGSPEPRERPWIKGVGERLTSLLTEGLDVPNSPKAVIKAGLDRGVVLESDHQLALDMIADRNTCSHVYRQALVPAILGRLPAFCAVMQTIAARLT